MSGGARRRPIPAAPAALVAALATALAISGASAAPRVLDDFERSDAWSAVPASGVAMKLATEPGPSGNALRVDFDFQKGGGYAVLRRALPLSMPENYRFTVRLRGECLPQNFEFKLIAPGGENVWWVNRRDFHFPREWRTVATRARHVEFAWGPAGGGVLREVEAIEFAITAGQGGSGTVWFDDLTLEELPPPSASPPAPVATSSPARAGSEAGRAADGDTATAWRPARAGAAWIELDLGEVREFGGLVLDWGAGPRPTDYEVRAAIEPGAFRSIRRVSGAGGDRDFLFLPESEARRVRIEMAAVPAGAALRGIDVRPIEFSKSRNDFFAAIARERRRGLYPRGMRGERQLWAVAGTPGGLEESFLSEDGAADLGVGLPSIEPFLWTEDRLWTWADIRTTPTLAPDPLPIPQVEWSGAPVDLAVRAAAAAGATPDADELHLRYRVLNRGVTRRRGRLLLALRPFQVNPPSQFLNAPGGACGLATLRFAGDVVELDSARTLRFSPRPAATGAARFDAGDVTRFLEAGRVPGPASVEDPEGYASGAAAFPFDLAPGESLVVRVSGPLARGRGPFAAPGPIRDAGPAIEAAWRAQLGPARIVLPPSAREVERSLAAQIGWIAVNRDGPAIQPGSRAYARSWIRDGSLTCTALLRWGRFEEVRRFLEWFEPYLYDDGKVPCCVDRRGSDPVPEHDSHGEWIYLVAEYLRHTGDTETLGRMWPSVARAADYLDSLRAQRRTAEWRDSSRIEFFGLLPPSISHEGYSAKPMHSYWDDFWAVRGFADAAFLARRVGDHAAARRYDASLTEFRRDFAASIAATQKRHGIPYVPGCADLGDFDATSTTIALSPVEADDLAPAGSIATTFERYWNFFSRRRDGAEAWTAFTPYEIRNVGAFVRLGWRGRAQALIAWFLDQRYPSGWAQWSEVAYRERDPARFLGDIPHTWVGSDFVRSILDCFAYEHERDGTLVLAAGVAESWVRDGDGLSVAGLHTHYGPLHYRMRGDPRGMQLDIEAGPAMPPGGIVVRAPGMREGSRAIVNGRPVTAGADGSVVIRSLPASVRLAP